MPKILLVEDNEMNRDMLSRRLQRRGYELCPGTVGSIRRHPIHRRPDDYRRREELRPAALRLGLMAAMSLSRHQSIKLHGGTCVYHRTDNDFWAVGIAWQYRWGGGL